MIKKSLFAMILLALFSFNAVSALKEGEQYTLLQQPVTAAPKIIEFFSFYCGPCYQFTEQYPVSEGINRILPAGEKVTKYHVSVMGKLGHELTQAWAIAMLMGKTDAVEKPLFAAIQTTKSLNSVADIKAIFAQAGITAQEYESAQNSLVVKALVTRQEAAITSFAVRGTPSFYVNGRYQINNAGIKADTPAGYVSEFANVVSELLAQ
jgi:thiol:disulfide interchange protein DsbA